jgi:hypothetical protein
MRTDTTPPLRLVPPPSRPETLLEAMVRLRLLLDWHTRQLDPGRRARTSPPPIQ